MAAITTSTVNATPASALGAQYSFMLTTGWYLDSVEGTELSTQPQSSSTTQVFTLVDAPNSAYQIESVAQPGQCALAHGRPWSIWLKPCDPTDAAQQWHINLNSALTHLESVAYPANCMVGMDGYSYVNLLSCDDRDPHSWEPFAR